MTFDTDHDIVWELTAGSLTTRLVCHADPRSGCRQWCLTCQRAGCTDPDHGCELVACQDAIAWAQLDERACEYYVGEPRPPRDGRVHVVWDDYEPPEPRWWYAANHEFAHQRLTSAYELERLS